ncbi:unnamed protein product [Alopecurus aequalis]
MKERAMGFVSFVGRVLFASLFFFSAYKDASEFGTDDGPAAKSLEPKYNLFVKAITCSDSVVPPLAPMIKAVIAATVYLRVVGGGLLILDSRLGAFLLLVYLLFITPVVIVYDSNNYERGSPEHVQVYGQFLQNIALHGALLFFFDMKNDRDEELEERRTTKTKRRTTKSKKI